MRDRLLMKKYKNILLVLLCFILAGCSKSLPDTYQEGSDYQYMEKKTFSAYHQTGEDVHYFAHGHYIYYMDRESKIILPLCGKADCLHDKETDSEKKQNCNAYMETESADTGIAYCNGYLYYLELSDFSAPVLYCLSADGTKKEQMYQWADNVTIEQWIVHRDVLYYVEHIYLSEKDKTAEQYAVKALSLTGKMKKPGTIYKVEKNLDVFTVAHPQAYGNFLYFQVYAQKKTEEEVTKENCLHGTCFIPPGWSGLWNLCTGCWMSILVRTFATSRIETFRKISIFYENLPYPLPNHLKCELPPNASFPTSCLTAFLSLTLLSLFGVKIDFRGPHADYLALRLAM